ncbi:hypothetical protein AAHH78_33480 [Burkholderia pseudomallei]
MREILDTIHKKKAALLDHPVFPQLESVTLPVINEMMRVWSALLFHLAMTFRDIYRMY